MVVTKSEVSMFDSRYLLLENKSMYLRCATYE